MTDRMRAAYITSHGSPDVIQYGELPARSPGPTDAYDLWIDNSGRHDLETAVPLLAQGGRIIALAGRAARPVLPMGAPYTRDASIRGIVISNASTGDLADAAKLINDQLAAKRLRARKRPALPLSAAAEAHRQMEAGVRGARPAQRLKNSAVSVSAGR